MNTKFLSCLVFVILASVDASKSRSASIERAESNNNISLLEKDTIPKSTRKDIKSRRDYIESNRNLMISNRLGRLHNSQNEPLIKPRMLFISGAVIVLLVASGIIFYWRSRDSSLIEEEQV